MFALGSVVSGETFANSRRIVASSTTGAVTSLCVTVSLKHIRTRGTLNKRAIRTTTTKIANTSDMLVGIPGGGVCAGSLSGKLFLSEANTGIGASVGADGSLASDTLIVGEAGALSGGAVTVTLVRALNNGVKVIGRLNVSYPSHGFGASALGAISGSPSGIAILTVVASTLVVDPAGSIATAPIGAVGDSHSGKGSEQKSTEHYSC